MNEIQPYKSQLPAKPEQFATNFTPAKCLQHFNNVTTPALCLQAQVPTLASIRKQYSEDFILAFIELWLDNLNDFVNAGKKMNAAQMQETAILIYQDYFYFNMADFNLVFRKIKKGDFGSMYSMIDGVKILSWFEKYSQERMNTAENTQIDFHNHISEPGQRSNKAEAERIGNMRAQGFAILNKK